MSLESHTVPLYTYIHTYIKRACACERASERERESYLHIQVQEDRNCTLSYQTGMLIHLR